MSKPKTLQVVDIYRYGQEKIVHFGVQRLFDEFQLLLDSYNAQSNEMFSTLVAGETAERRWKFGTSDHIDFVDMEFLYGRADADSVGFSEYEVGLPLYTGGAGVQWNKRYYELETVERFNQQMNAYLLADTRWLRKKIGAALFGNTNYTFKDKYYDNLPLYVKRLLNADGDPIPMTPEGNTLDPSDAAGSHYHVYTAVNDANMKAIENNLLEHVTAGKVIHLIHKDQEAAVRALTGFTKARDPRIDLGITNNVISALFQAEYEINTNLEDRLVGIVEDGGEYWVKPWIPSGYIFSYLEDSVLAPPLMRRRDQIESSDLAIVTPIDVHPALDAKTVKRTVGFGVAERRNGHVAKIDAGNGPYSVPTVFR